MTRLSSSPRPVLATLFLALAVALGAPAGAQDPAPASPFERVLAREVGERDLRDRFEPAEGRARSRAGYGHELEHALFVADLARLWVGVRGSGRLSIRVERDGAAPLERELDFARDGVHTETLDLPGDGLRALRLDVRLGRGLELLSAAVQEPLVPPTPASPLRGALAGRSVILFIEDSLCARHLSAYGYDRDTSPFLERLAAEGVLFESAYSQTSWTLSSMSSLFTSVEQERHRVLHLDERLGDGFTTIAELFHEAGYRTAGLVQNGIVYPQTGLDRGFEEYTIYPWHPNGTRDLLGRALELALEESDRPIFLYVHLTPPHQPYDPPEQYRDRYVDPNYDGEVDGSIVSCAIVNRDKPPPGSPDLEHLRALYDAHVRYADDVTGSLLSQLHAQERLDDFLVIKTADHGEAFMQHGVQGHNANVYEEMIHVPLMLFAPGSPLPKSRRVRETVSLLDVYPTLVELLGLGEPRHLARGRSVLPLLHERAETSGLPRPHFYTARYRQEGSPLKAALRFGDWKLVRDKDGFELYDIDEDAGERVDLAADHAVTVAALRRRLEEWYRDATDARAATHKIELDADRLEVIQQLGYAGDEEF